MTSQVSSVLKPLISLGGLRVLGIGLSFLQAVIMARVFGAEVFGVFSFAVSTVTLLGLISSFGFDQLLTREAAILGGDSAGSAGQLRALLYLASKFVLPAIAVVSAIGPGVVLLGAFEDAYRAPLLVVTLSFSVLMCRKFAEAFALGVKKAALSFVGSKVAFPAIMILGAIALDRAGLVTTSRSVAGLYLVALVASTGLVLLVLRQELACLRAAKGQGEPDQPQNSRVNLKAALYLTLVMAGNMVINHMDTVLLAALSTPVEAAYAKVAWRLSDAVTLLQTIALIQIRPFIAAAYGRKDSHALQAQLQGLAKVLGATGLLAFSLMMVLAPQFLQLFGTDFVGASPALRAYALGALGTVLGGPGTVVLSMTGHEQAASRILWGVLVVNLLLNLALIPGYGATGAGVATAVSQWCMAVTTAFSCRSRLGVDPSAAVLFRKHRQQEGQKDI